MKVAPVNPPDDYYQLPENDISSQLCTADETPDFIHVFAGGQKEFERQMRGAQAVHQQEYCDNHLGIVV